MFRRSAALFAAVLCGGLAACTAGSSPSPRPYRGDAGADPLGKGDDGEEETEGRTETFGPDAGSAGSEGDAAAPNPDPRPDSRTDAGSATGECTDPEGTDCGCGGACEAEVRWGELVWSPIFNRDHEEKDAYRDRLMCPEGSVATGIFGKEGSYIDQLGLYCRELTTAHEGRRTIRVDLSSESHETGVSGGGGWLAGSFDQSCPEGTVMHRIAGKQGWYVDQLRFGCAELTAARDGDTSGAFERGDTTEDVGPVGGNGGAEFGPWQCPAGTLPVGVHAWWALSHGGQVVNMVSLKCKEASILLR